jgi:hypothetical protein
VSDDVRDELQRRVLEQTEVARLGEAALESTDLSQLYTIAAEVVARTLDVQYAGVLELDAEQPELIPRSAYGWPPEILGR